MARRDITGAIDFDYLESYVSGDRALMAEVLGLFEEQAGLWGRLLDPAAGESWRDGAHTLKGSALGVGARDVAAVCTEAEAAWDEPAEFKNAIKSRLDHMVDLALADIAAWRHEELLRGLR